MLWTLNGCKPLKNPIIGSIFLKFAPSSFIEIPIVVNQNHHKLVGNSNIQY
jgi:hypothetical protein